MKIVKIKQRIKKDKPIIAGNIRVELVWFDSLGAKSSSVFIQTPDINLLIDPGTAEMQPSYPLSALEKSELAEVAFQAIKKASWKADTIFISHYHYDHHTLPEDEGEAIYRGKRLLIKDPNRWINQSQWERARLFFNQLSQVYANTTIESYLCTPAKESFADPLNKIPVARDKDFDSYQKRREELFKKGRAWFKKLSQRWKKGPWISEGKFGSVDVSFVDGRKFKFGSTILESTPPLFHGIEYDRVGWVVGLVLVHKKSKVLYASDLQGPGIEDYALWIIKENPDILILDGPATYLFGYMVNRINLQRAIENAISIIRNTDTRVIIYDHHLTRDRLFRQRLREVYEVAELESKTFLTAAEWLGDQPLILKLREEKRGG